MSLSNNLSEQLKLEGELQTQAGQTHDDFQGRNASISGEKECQIFKDILITQRHYRMKK